MAEQTFRSSDLALVEETVSDDLAVSVTGKSAPQSIEIVLLRDAKEKVLSSALKRLDIRESWIAALKLKDGDEANSVAVNFAQDLVQGGSQQLRAVAQCVMSYHMTEVVLAYKPPPPSAADIKKSADLATQVELWSTITKASKDITFKMLDTISDASELSLRLCSLNGGLTRFYEGHKAGAPFEYSLPYVTDEVTKFVAFSQQMREKLADAQDQAKMVLGNLIDCMTRFSAADELRENMKKLQEESEALVVARRELSMELCDAREGVGKWRSELARLRATVANADTMIRIADGDIDNAEEAAKQYSQMATSELDKARESIVKVESRWEEPKYEPTYTYDWTGYDSSNRCMNCRADWYSCRCRVQNLSGRKNIGFETHLKVTMDTQESDYRKGLAEKAKQYAVEFVQRQRTAAAEKDRFVKEKEVAGEAIVVLEGKIEAKTLEIDTRVKSKTEEIQKKELELGIANRELKRLTASSGVAEQKLVEFGCVMTDFKQAVLCAQITTDDQRRKVEGFVTNLERAFTVQMVESPEEKEDDAVGFSVKKPAWIATKEKVQAVLEDTFGSLEDDDLRIEEGDWDEEMDETFATEAGLKKMQIKQLTKWLMRDVHEKKAAEEQFAAAAKVVVKKESVAEFDQKYIVGVVRPLIGFLSMFRDAADETSKSVVVGSPDFAAAKKQCQAAIRL